MKKNIGVKIVKSDEANSVEAFHRNVLLGLKDVFTKREQISIINEPNDIERVYMLSTLYTGVGVDADDIMGEFFFLPVRKDDNLKFYIFTIVLSITEDMVKENYEDLCKAVSKINFSLPVGAFVLDEDEQILAYKNVCIVPIRSSVNEAVTMVDTSIKVSLKMMAQHVDLLSRLERGNIDYIEFLQKMYKEQNVRKNHKHRTDVK